MAALVAAGVMSLTWMALLTWVVFVERLFPQRRGIAIGVGSALVVLGLIVAAGVARMAWTA